MTSRVAQKVILDSSGPLHKHSNKDDSRIFAKKLFFIQLNVLKNNSMILLCFQAFFITASICHLQVTKAVIETCMGTKLASFYCSV